MMISTTYSSPRASFGWIVKCMMFVGTCNALASCAPPRFDVFSEKIVASWHTSPSGENEAVEEVMRSCGGAVQGIRDVPLLGSPYLNRADDGFVFYDCGSYTHGPVTLSDENVMTASLMLTSKSRVLLSATLDNKKVVKPKVSSRLQRVSFGDDGSSLTGEDFAIHVDEKEPSDITWNEQLQCRMPSTGQPWMLQRVKWEKFLDKEDDDAPNFGAEVQTWAMALPFEEYNAESSSLDKYDGDGLVVSMGATCRETGSVKALLRNYNKGSLVRVALQHGAI